ncbi:hypothetical protein ABH931_003802 [Streptacidiphilus sp. MAP12-33]|uniref:hypothetical protein n=1 Tax=Streptacidiphilus sp. MAP12-33 TaxID=3156266 RepID=UPI0035182DF6
MSRWDGVSLRGGRADGTVERIRFRVGPLQSLQFGAAFAIPFWGGFVVSHLSLGDPYPHGLWTAAIFYALFMSLLQTDNSVELTEPCLVLRNGLGRREAPWTAIRAMETRSLLGTRSVRVHLTNGERLRLRTPLTGFPYDPDFDRKVATLQVWWAIRRGW